MNNNQRIFYDHWAASELNNPQRDTILKWKAVNLANLFLRTVGTKTISSVCEIGGAEGIILNQIGHILGANQSVNYDLSSVFCATGSQMFPHIQFNNYEFTGNNDFYDLIILSDIIEHVENENDFLAMISKHCQYVLFKIPIEKCFEYYLTFLLKPRGEFSSLRYGPNHYNGHLRGYTINQAKNTIKKHFKILDSHYCDVLFFYKGKKRLRLKKLVGVRGTMLLFGGALFILAKTKTY
jgi:hypothetical protein